MEQIKKEHADTGILDRASYIVGLSAALLAFFPFRDNLSVTSIPIFGQKIPLYYCGLIFLGLLLVSAYLYGLNSIRYSIPWILERSWSKYLEIIASGFYILAFIFPLVIIVVALITFAVSNLPSIPKDYAIIFQGLSVLLGVLSGAVAAFSITVKSYKEKLNAIKETLQENSLNAQTQTKTAFADGDLRLSLLSLFESLVDSLKGNLTSSIGTQAERLSTIQILKIASDKGLIQSDEIPTIEELRVMRNRVAHNLDAINISYDYVKNIRAKVEPILERLQSVSERKIQAILDLLKSFGADVTTVMGVENVFRGKKPTRMNSIFNKVSLTQAQIQAIIALLQSFGTKQDVIENIRLIVTGP